MGCDKNFDAIYAEWENGEQDEAQKPEKGNLGCSAGVTLKGVDPESGEVGDLKLNLCVPLDACGGFEGGDPEAEGYIKIEADSCMGMGATKLMAGVAAAITLYATI